MSLREKERAKEQQEKFQAILSALLKDEDNKYCVDCDAKGPRWASWNLGIFMCIRCAGIHRNLGVHISKVKSVNLDTWTAEQIAMMKEVGNSRARAVYEANIPDGFRRPQSDSALEAFIRAKYEHKKYIAREWIPPTPQVPKEWLEDPRSEKKRSRPKPATGSQIQLGGAAPKAAGKPAGVGAGALSGDNSSRPAQGVKAEVKVAPVQQEPAKPSSAANDLLGLEAVAPAPQSSSNELLDLFGGLQPGSNPSAGAPAASSDLMNGASSEGNLFEGEGAGEEKKASTKDSIMALFGGTGGGGGGGAPAGPQQMYNVPVSSAQLAQNGISVPMVASATATMPGNAVNGSNLRLNSQAPVSSLSQMMVNQPRASPQTSYSAQPGLMTQIQSALTSLTANQQHYNVNTSSSAMNCAPQTNNLNQQAAGMSAAQAQQIFNPPAAQKPNPAGSAQLNPFLATKQQQQQQASPSAPPLIPGGASSDAQTKPGGSVMSSYGQTPYGQQFRPPMLYGQAQANFYGGMYMPQGQQQAYPGMMGANMMGQPQGMMGQQQSMMGQQQSMMGYPANMMGQQPQGLMGTPAMNGSQQMGMYNNQMMGGGQGGQGMYTPQQMQQLQFQQMQQQMAAMNMGGAQQMQGGWGGNPGAGQTLSNNLWQ